MSPPRAVCTCTGAWPVAEGGIVHRVLLAYAALPIALRALAPVLLMATVWYLSSLPQLGGDGSAWSSFWHNGAHVVAYGSLGAAWLLAVRGDGWTRLHVLTAVLLSCGYGIVDELHQSHVHGRVCSPSDICTDTAGAWLGAMAILAIARRSTRARRSLPALLLLCLGCVCLATWGPW